MPAKAGIQNYLKTLDSRLRGNDAKGRFKTLYETINVGRSIFDVQSVYIPGQAEFHMSAAACLKNDRFNHQKTLFSCTLGDSAVKYSF